MNKLYLVVVSFFVFLLVACNGHNEDESENLPQTVTKIELSILDSNGVAQHSFNTNDTITLQAKVTDENNAVVPNRAVSFSASVGSLAISSKLTNSEGLAIVYLTNEEFILGAGSAIASIDELTTLTLDYEFIESTAIDTPPNLTTTVTLNNESVNLFKADEEVQIFATLTDGNDQGIANKIITFTADIGTLNMATALTNSQGVASVTLSADDTGSESVIGAGVITSSYAIEEDINISNTLNYQILPADSIIDSDIHIGYLDEKNNFVEGKIAFSIEDKMISAGGTLGLSVNLIDKNGNLLVTPIPVTFTSNCVQNGNARIDESVLSINGTAHSTFEDVDCAGRNGADDIIFASVTVNEITHTASETVTINGEQLGSIEFIAAEPSEIVLKGTGGQNQQETSTLTFKVKSQLGNVLAQQEVNFTLSTAVGAINLSRISGFTNSQGLISTQISAGTVPTAVRVTASASMDVNGENITVQSQSDLLSINTGLPEQRSMTIAAVTLNPEAHNISGVTSLITVWLSDNFNNPAPDGTTVNFTTEGGNIEPSCVTTNGSCSVTWASSEPRVADHRVTILATALGWTKLPAAIRHKIPEGSHSILLIPVVLFIGWLSFAMSESIELWVFDGNVRQYLTNELGMTFDQRNSLVVGIAMGFAVIPTIFSIAEDAVFSVPKHLSNGSLALGATQWQTLIRVVLLTASPGIFSAVMMGLGRAVGETMIVLMATGNTPIMDWSIFQGMRTLAANIAVEMPESEVGSSHYRILFLAAFVLFIFTFIFNTVAEFVRQQLREKYSSM